MGVSSIVNGDYKPTRLGVPCTPFIQIITILSHYLPIFLHEMIMFNGYGYLYIYMLYTHDYLYIYIIYIYMNFKIYIYNT